MEKHRTRSIEFKGTAHPMDQSRLRRVATGVREGHRQPQEVMRLMKQNGLTVRGSVQRPTASTTGRFSRTRQEIADNWSQLSVADITYIAIATSFVYLGAILDAWSRRVVGYAIGKRIDARWRMLDAAMDSPHAAAGVALVPGAIELLSDGPELHASTSCSRPRKSSGAALKCLCCLRRRETVAWGESIANEPRETWPIRSKRFRGWLRRRYYEATGGALAEQAISSELDLLEARAQFDAPERSVHVRVAEHEGHIYLDLADEHWRAIEIGPDGWRVNRCPPVRFRRPAGMLPLPVPEKGGSIETLLPFLNLSSRNDFVLVVAWLLATLRPSGPYPLLAISGEQGSAKTVLSKMLKALVDPNVAPVRALPREERELMIAANNGYVLAFDNLSGLPAGSRMRSVGSRAVEASRCGSSIPTMTRCYFKRRAPCS
jgi:hypothetical protein